jgi:hypothetical protein
MQLMLQNNIGDSQRDARPRKQAKGMTGDFTDSVW